MPNVASHSTQEMPAGSADESLGVDIFDAETRVDTPTESRISRFKHWVSSHPRKAIGIVVVVLVLALSAFLFFRSSSGSTQAMTRTVQATKGEVSKTVNASGTVEPKNSEALSFEVSGTVNKVYVKEGATVKKNQRLASVNAGVLEAQLTAAESSVTAAEDSLSSARSSGSATQIAAAQSQLATAKDSLAAAQLSVKNSVLRAPFSGQVVSLGISKGDVVGQQASGGQSGSADGAGGQTSSTDSSSGSITVASTKKFVVDATVGSTDIEQVADGMQAEVTVSGSDETHYGTVSSISKVATTNSSGSAVFPVVIDFTGSVDGVFGGTSATAQITAEVRSEVLTVPTQALETEDGKTYVTVVESDGGTRQQEVTVGETYGTSTEILSGIEDGQSVQITLRMPGGGGMPGGDGGSEQEMPENFPGDGSGGFPGGGTGGFPGGGSGGFPGGGQ